MARVGRPAGRRGSVLIWLLDTDHLSILERGGGSALPIQMRLGRVLVEEVGTTIVNYEEQMRGWLAEAAAAKTLRRVQEAYALLEEHIATFRDLEILSFDAEAASEFERLRQTKIRVGTKDLRIATICLANGATLPTRNSKDFGQVPGLKFEDWSR